MTFDTSSQFLNFNHLKFYLVSSFSTIIFFTLVIFFSSTMSLASNLPPCKIKKNFLEPNYVITKNWTNCYGEANSRDGTYKGEWLNGKKHGIGKFDQGGGIIVYEGEWHQNQKHGIGREKYSFNSGEWKIYTGEWKNNKRDGRGTEEWSFGTKEIGIFRKGIHREGIKIDINGEIVEGVFEPRKFIPKKFIPDNSYPLSDKNGFLSWKCKSGYKKSGSFCKKTIKIPDNAYASGDSWKCRTGYEQSGNTCKKKLETKKEVVPDEVLQAASGTGFIVSEAGHIITNNHVIEGCADVKVHKEGDVYKGKILAKDKINDLALIKSNYKPNVIFPLSDKNPSILQPIIVAGFPFGNVLSSSVKVTQGIVSSETGIGNNYSNIQIDAALQPGNSGGPILDKKGNVVAVAVAKLAMKKIYEDFGVFPENTNFGIKSSVVESLIQTHNIKNPSPYSEEMSIDDLGYNIKQATLYLSCWMTLAQIKKFSTKKVMFRDLVN